MKLLKKVVLIPLISGILFLSCDKKKESPTGPTINHDPIIEQIVANPSQIFSGDNTYLECIAEDEDGDPLSYDWDCNDGTFNQNGESETMWTSPSEIGNLEYLISVTVNDNQGGSAFGNVPILVMTRYDTILVSDDAYVSSFSPTWNPQIEWSNLLSLYKNLEGTTEGYLFYDNLNPEKGIKSAKLRLSIMEYGGTGIYPDSNEPLLCDIQKVTNLWTSVTLTWETKPEYDITPILRFTIPTVQQYPGTFYVEGLTDLVKSWKDNPSSNHGLALVPYGFCSGYIGRLLYSEEGASMEGNINLKSALIIEYE